MRRSDEYAIALEVYQRTVAGKLRALDARWPEPAERAPVDERAYPHQAHIQVDNPFVASGVEGRGFRKVPLLSREAEDLSSDYWSTGPWILDTGFSYGWGDEIAMLDDENRVLLISGQAASDLYVDEHFEVSHATSPHYVTTGAKWVGGTELYENAGQVVDEPSPAPGTLVAPWRLFVAAAIPSAVTVTGLLFLIGGVLTEPARPNAYVGLFLLLAGVGLITTALLAIRDASSRT